MNIECAICDDDIGRRVVVMIHGGAAIAGVLENFNKSVVEIKEEKSRAETFIDANCIMVISFGGEYDPR